MIISITVFFLSHNWRQNKSYVKGERQQKLAYPVYQYSSVIDLQQSVQIYIFELFSSFLKKVVLFWSAPVLDFWWLLPRVQTEG